MVKLKIKEIAEEKGFNMASLTRKADLGFSTIKRMWRNPYKSVSTEILEKIARALGVSIHDLIEEESD